LKVKEGLRIHQVICVGMQQNQISIFFKCLNQSTDFQETLYTTYIQ